MTARTESEVSEVERVAKLLWDTEEKYWADRLSERTKWKDCPSVWQKSFRAMARAVIRDRTKGRTRR